MRKNIELTNQDILAAHKALTLLEGRVEEWLTVDKPKKLISYEFDKDGKCRYAISKNLETFGKEATGLQKLTEQNFKQCANGDQELTPGSAAHEAFRKLQDTLFDTKEEVRVWFIDWAWLNVEKNRIPTGVLAALSPVLTGAPEGEEPDEPVTEKTES